MQRRQVHYMNCKISIYSVLWDRTIIKIENLGLKMLPYVVLTITILTYWLDTKYFKLCHELWWSTDVIWALWMLFRASMVYITRSKLASLGYKVLWKYKERDRKRGGKEGRRGKRKRGKREGFLYTHSKFI